MSIVGCDLETHPLSVARRGIRFVDNISSIDDFLASVDSLVDQRLQHRHGAAASRDLQVAFAIERQVITAGDREPDRSRISARSDYKIALDFVLRVPVVNEIDSRPYVVLSHGSVSWNVRAPAGGIASEKIVYAAGQRITRIDFL